MHRPFVIRFVIRHLIGTWKWSYKKATSYQWFISWWILSRYVQQPDKICPCFQEHNTYFVCVQPNVVTSSLTGCLQPCCIPWAKMSLASRGFSAPEFVTWLLFSASCSFWSEWNHWLSACLYPRIFHFWVLADLDRFCPNDSSSRMLYSLGIGLMALKSWLD